LFGFEQELHTQLARLSASARRRGLADPLDGLTKVRLEDIDRFGLSAEQREQLILDLVGKLLAGSTEDELRRGGEALALVGPRPIDRSRAARCQLELASRFMEAGKLLSAAAWGLRAVKWRPRSSFAIVRSIAARAGRKIATPRLGFF